MTDTDERPRFRVEFHLTRLAERVSTEPLRVPDKVLDQAWNMLSAFFIDLLDDFEPDATDERYREAFIEVCYRLIFREMFTLNVLPVWEHRWQERLGTRERGVRLYKKGPYDDGSWHKEDL